MPEMAMQHCKCGASWLGHSWERCDWCWKRGEIALEMKRKALLHPEWLQDQGPKYWELDEVSRQVWNTTRGIHHGEHITRQWAQDLDSAVADDVITLQEALGALRRWERMKLTQLKNSTMPGNPESDWLNL